MIENIVNHWGIGFILLLALAYYLGTKKANKNLEEKISCEIDEHTEFRRICEGVKKLNMDIFKLKEKVKENTSFKEEHKYIKIDLDKKIKEAKQEMTPEDNDEIQLLKQELKKLKIKVKKFEKPKRESNSPELT